MCKDTLFSSILTARERKVDYSATTSVSEDVASGSDSAGVGSGFSSGFSSATASAGDTSSVDTDSTTVFFAETVSTSVGFSLSTG